MEQGSFPAGELFRWIWFQRYDNEPVRVPNDIVVQSWDTASKGGDFNSYSVCTTWLIRNEDFYLLDVFRKRLQYPDLRRAVIEQARQYRPKSVLIEDKASGTSLLQDLRANRIAEIGYPIDIKPEADKITRASAQSALIESGRVYLSSNARWLEDLRKELLQFPNGQFDDQVDSITQCLKWAVDRERNTVRSGRTTGMW